MTFISGLDTKLFQIILHALTAFEGVRSDSLWQHSEGVRLDSL